MNYIETREKIRHFLIKKRPYIAVNAIEKKLGFTSNQLRLLIEQDIRLNKPAQIQKVDAFLKENFNY